jgi:hypothetical protein
MTGQPQFSAPPCLPGVANPGVCRRTLARACGPARDEGAQTVSCVFYRTLLRPGTPR